VRADEFLRLCRKTSEDERGVEACVAPEFVKGLVEVSTPPVATLAELEQEYLDNLRLALRAARSLGIRLYPLGTYPLPLKPVMREETDYQVQVRTVGPERFAHAGRCAGTHLHLELAAGTVSPDAGISASASEDAKAEALNLHNLATALDPALISVTRSCPFYEGAATGAASRVVRYRGSEEFGWDGVYRDLPMVGALLPDAGSVEQLVRQQFDRYEVWLEARDRAGVERRLFLEAGGDLLRPAWNPVRLNRHGTVELRGMDSNYPDITLAAAALIVGAADRVRGEALAVVPDERARTFELDEENLRVPGFGYLEKVLLRAAATAGAGNPAVTAYVDSVLEFVGEEERLAELRRDRITGGGYPTTEARLLREYRSENGHLPEKEGLRLVLDACDELEARASGLSRQEGEPADAL
jgi:gamma-glutamyl:cysteine ligase YbdK (ATP-grasp superfamily)